MTLSKNKVIVGMSGGVDSAVTAYLLQKEGYEVIGATLRTWEGNSSRCCEIDKARNSAFKLGIKYYPWNVTDDFREYVTEPFVKEYLQGRTPNPCVECNPKVKWAGLLHIADTLGAEFVATGHYASIVKLENGRFSVKKGFDEKKDQSYMLYRLTQEQLYRTLLPLGDMKKTDVKETAQKLNLVSENQKESQEICFVTEGSYADYLEKEAGKLPIGNFIDESGNILGKHNGIARYTVGQRKGLGVAMGHPVYVRAILPETNEVILSEDDALYVDEIYCKRLNAMGVSDFKTSLSHISVKIRYHHSGTYADMSYADDDTLRISFEEPVRAPTPGQSAVFYDEDGYVLGGGIIK